MFVLSPTETPDTTRPTILYGYGGFGIPMQPAYSATALSWVEAGGVYAVAGLRGGGEEGEQWHRDGMLGNKQNVFDDFHAAAEWLIDNGWTTPAQLAINGGSNGGLLVGAALAGFTLKLAFVGVETPSAYDLATGGAPALGSGLDQIQGIVVEAILTAILVYAVLLTAADARAVAEAAAAAGVTCMVDHLLVLHPGVTKVKELVDSGYYKADDLK